MYPKVDCIVIPGHKQVIELLRYAGVSAVALGIDVSCLWWWASIMPVLWAAAASFVVGGCVAYLLSVRFVFAHRDVVDRRLEASLFLGLGLVGLALNLLVIGVATQVALWPPLLSKALAASATFACNYKLRHHWLFTPRRQAVSLAKPRR